MLKLESQNRMITEIVEPESESGSKYKAKYEEKCKKEDEIMLRLYESKTCDTQGLMQLFGINSEQTFRNRLTKARKADHGQD